MNCNKFNKLSISFWVKQMFLQNKRINSKNNNKSKIKINSKRL